MKQSKYETMKRLGYIRDAYIEEAALSAEGVRACMRRRRRRERLSRVVQSNWFVAAICTLVSLSAVSWITYMGQRVPTETPPPYGSVQGSHVSDGTDRNDGALSVLRPYEGMSREELYELYRQHKPAIEQTVTDHMSQQYQTPYYVFLNDPQNGVRVLNKLTGEYESICQKDGCTHTDPFACPAAYAKGLVPGTLRVSDDRIYAVLDNGQGEQTLFTFSLDLTESRTRGAYTAHTEDGLVYRNLIADDDYFYDICMQVFLQDGVFTFFPSLFLYDRHEMQELSGMVSCISVDEHLYFSTLEGIYEANMRTGEVSMMVSAHELGYEVYDTQERSSSGYPLLTALRDGCLYVETVMATGERRYTVWSPESGNPMRYTPAWEDGGYESFLVYGDVVYAVKDGVVYCVPMEGGNAVTVARLPHTESCTLHSCDGKVLYLLDEARLIMIETETGEVHIS